MQQVFWVALAGTLGALSRWGVTVAAERFGEDLPWGTLIVNGLGSILLGFLVEAAIRADWPPEVKVAVGTGFLGSFTTFSTFSVETVRLLETGEYTAAGANVAANLILGLGGAAVGIWLAMRMQP